MCEVLKQKSIETERELCNEAINNILTFKGNFRVSILVKFK